MLQDLETPIFNLHQALNVITKKHTSVHLIIRSMHYSGPFIPERIAMGAKGFYLKL